MDQTETSGERGGAVRAGRRRSRRVSLRTRGAFASQGDPSHLRRSRSRRRRIILFWALSVSLGLVLASALFMAMRGRRPLRDRAAERAPTSKLPTIPDPFPSRGGR